MPRHARVGPVAGHPGFLVELPLPQPDQLVELGVALIVGDEAKAAGEAPKRRRTLPPKPESLDVELDACPVTRLDYAADLEAFFDRERPGSQSAPQRRAGELLVAVEADLGRRGRGGSRSRSSPAGAGNLDPRAAEP